jgi:hypothetical protein
VAIEALLSSPKLAMSVFSSQLISYLGRSMTPFFFLWLPAPGVTRLLQAAYLAFSSELAGLHKTR